MPAPNKREAVLGYSKGSFDTNRKRNFPDVNSREAYIDYALNVVTKNLIKTGRLNPSNAQMLHTPEVKEHIGLMCDKMNECSRVGTSPAPQDAAAKISNIQKNFKKKIFPASKGGEIIRYSIKPSSLPVKLSKLDERDGSHSKRVKIPAVNKYYFTDSKTKRSGENFFTSIMDGDLKGKNINKRLSNSMSKGSTGDGNLDKGKRINSSTNQDSKIKSQRMIAAQQDIRATFGREKSIYGTGKIFLKNKESIKKELGSWKKSGQKIILANKPGLEETENSRKQGTYTAQAFQAKLDLRGYHNDEISLDMDDRRLVIVASRPKRDGMNARKITEVIEIPHGVIMGNLKIGRKPDGFVYIEEYVADN